MILPNVCPNCGRGDHKATECSNQNNPTCPNCKGNHSAWHPSCPKRQEAPLTVKEYKPLAVERRTPSAIQEWIHKWSEATLMTWRVMRTYPNSGKTNVYKVDLRCQLNTDKRAQVLKYRNVSNEVKDKLIDLFRQERNPSSALNTHKLDLMMEYEDNNYYRIAADGKFLRRISIKLVRVSIRLPADVFVIASGRAGRHLIFNSCTEDIKSPVAIARIYLLVKKVIRLIYVGGSFYFVLGFVKSLRRRVFCFQYFFEEQWPLEKKEIKSPFCFVGYGISNQFGVSFGLDWDFSVFFLESTLIFTGTSKYLLIGPSVLWLSISLGLKNRRIPTWLSHHQPLKEFGEATVFTFVEATGFYYKIYIFNSLNNFLQY
uniref:Uncharacterized protein LOC114345881 n=1 Tax=Diabrotica virgifera virgifera TaxID=50390 RepID=A0A6P7GSI6_DIAVI